MKTVVCYGDSDTWGFSAARNLAGDKMPRYPRELRWTGVAAAALGGGYLVIEEGLNGRTTVFDDQVKGEYRNGRRCIQACLESHKPIDLVVIMLGINDLKVRFSATAADIARGAASLAKFAAASECGPDGSAPAVLLVSPPHVGPDIRTSPFGEEFGYEAAREKSLLLAERYAKEAAAAGVEFLDASRIVEADPLDSIHLTVESNAALGRAIAERVRAILER